MRRFCSVGILVSKVLVKLYYKLSLVDLNYMPGLVYVPLRDVLPTYINLIPTRVFEGFYVVCL
jgi:hypothetical protein